MVEASPELVERYRRFLERTGSVMKDAPGAAERLAAKEAETGTPSIVVFGKTEDGRVVRAEPGKDDVVLEADLAVKEKPVATKRSKRREHATDEAEKRAARERPMAPPTTPQGSLFA